jgi:hypothetical protein
MQELWLTLSFFVMNIALPYFVTRRDRRRLDRQQLARAWNQPSWACAVFFFGPLCLPAHFWVTRRTMRGLLQGCLWAAAVLALEWLFATGWETISAT